MRLHRIKMINFRGVESRELNFPDSGVVVIEGANEVGKSSIIDALDLLLDEKDGSAKAKVRSVKPVTADVGSIVEAEITSGSYRFTYRKQWNKNPQTNLEIIAPKPEHLSGSAAHDRVRQIFDQTVDAELWKALRILQADPLSQERLVDSGALANALDAAAGDTGTPEQMDDLFATVEAEYLRYFTKTGRPTGEYADTSTQVADATAASTEAASKLLEIEQDVDRHAKLSALLGDTQSGLDDARLELDKLTIELARVDALENSAADLRKSTQLAKSERDRVVSEANTRTVLLDDQIVRKRTIATLTTESSALSETLKSTRSLVDGEERALAKLRSATADAQGAADRAGNDLDHLRDLAELKRARKSNAQIAEARSTIDSASKLVANSRVDTAMLTRIESASEALQLALAREQSSAARVKIEPLGEVGLEINGETVNATVGETQDRAVIDPLQISVPGVVRLTVSPAMDVRALSREVESCRSTLSQALADANAADEQHAKALADARQAAERELKQANGRLSELLETEDAEKLRQKEITLSESTSQYRKERPQKTALPKDLDTAQSVLDRTKQEASKAETAQSHAEARLKEYETQLSTTTTELAVAQSKLTSMSDELKNVETRLQAMRDTIADAALKSTVTTAEAAHDAAVLAEQTLKEQLAEADPGSARTRLTNATNLVARLQGDQNTTGDELVTIEARLTVLGSQGRQEAFDAAETNLAAITRTSESISSRAKAAQLLYGTLQRHRDIARQKYIEPFQDQIVRLGKVLYGSTFSVHVNDDLQIETRTLHGVTLPYDVLSVGAKEQLAILTRLACAAIVDDTEGVPVIIDDALGYSDPERLALMGAVLGTSSARSQVFLLTCTPGRYSTIGSAEVIRL